MSNNTCEKLPTYREVRKENLSKITKYYNRLISGYESTSSSDTIKREKHEETLDELSKLLIKKLIESNQKIMDLHSDYEIKYTETETNRKKLRDLKHKIKRESSLSSGSNQSYENLHNKHKSLKNYNLLLFTANIIHLVINISVVLYILFYFGKKNNNNNSIRKNKLNNLNSINKR